jgi:CRP/FNR family transcriptional regulator, cAMP and macrophage regulator
LDGRWEPLPATELSARHTAWMTDCLNRGGLAPLGSDDIAALAARLGEQHYPVGSSLFRVGDAPTRVHIVRCGTVGLSRTLQGRRVILQILEPGDVVGDVALFVRTTQPFDAWVLEDSLMLSVDSLTLCSLLERRPRLNHRWLVSIAQRMAGVEARLADMLAGGLEVQVASLLLRRADRGMVHLNQAMLADLVGVSRTSVNRVLKQLEERGLVAVRYGGVEVLDPETLGTVAGNEPPAPIRRAKA